MGKEFPPSQMEGVLVPLQHRTSLDLSHLISFLPLWGFRHQKQCDLFCFLLVQFRVFLDIVELTEAIGTDTGVCLKLNGL